MYIEKVPNRSSRPTILLREGKREGDKVVKRTIANLTNVPEAAVEAMKRVLQGERLLGIDEAFSIKKSLPHGHVEMIMKMMRKIGFDTLISAKRCRERDLVMAMVAERLINPCSKLATTRHWHATSLAGEMNVEEAEVDELYDAMLWLVKRQAGIEKKLAKRHLREQGKVLYDVSSSYYEGRTCPLMYFGHSRDGRPDRPQIVYGLLTDSRGCPVSVEVYKGNVGDATTVPDQVEKLRERFGLSRTVLVGDRGMLTNTQIETLRKYPGLGWISCLRSGAIKGLIEDGLIDRSLFDECNLAEISSPDFPNERLVVCYNPLLADKRMRKREDLLKATENALTGLLGQVRRRTKKLLSSEEIALKVGKIINRWKMEKHLKIIIEDSHLEWSRDEDSIRKEQELDGLYVVRTSEPKESISAEDMVRTYKSLSQVERAFRSLKTVDLKVRPIRHRKEEMVRAHVLLCMLAYYVQWHLRKALAPVLFDDEQLGESIKTRNPVTKAEPSPSSKRKKAVKRTPDGFPLHSFQTLIQEMGTRCKNWCRISASSHDDLFEMLTEPSPFQSHVLRLIDCSQ